MGLSVQEISDAFASRIMDSSPDLRDRISLLFRLAYGRDPSSYEFQACRNFLREIDEVLDTDRRARIAEESPRDRRRRMAERRRAGNRNPQATTRLDEQAMERSAWASLCQTIFQSSEFRTLD